MYIYYCVASRTDKIKIEKYRKISSPTVYCYTVLYNVNVRKHYIYQGIGRVILVSPSYYTVLYNVNVRKHYIYQGIGRVILVSEKTLLLYCVI